MAIDLYGYRENAGGKQLLIPVLIDSSSAAIDVNDMLTKGTAGYFQKAAAGDIVECFAAGKCAVPSADGGVSILADFSTESVYEYPPDAGTVTQALVPLTTDTGGARSVDIDASTDDCLQIVRVDVGANTVFVRRIPIYVGVV